MAFRSAVSGMLVGTFFTHLMFVYEGAIESRLPLWLEWTLFIMCITACVYFVKVDTDDR